MGRRAKVSREQVLAAARELFVARGFEGTTLAAIAGALALSPAALLRHAPTKQALFEAAMEYFGPARARRQELEANPGRIDEILEAGKQRVQAKGREVLERVRKVCGLGAHQK